MPVKNKTKLDPMEAELEALLHPVHPSKRFVQTMRRRIQFTPPVEVTPRLSSPPALIIIMGGVLSASLLIITAARAIFYLTHRIKA